MLRYTVSAVTPNACGTWQFFAAMWQTPSIPTMDAQRICGNPSNAGST
jgi:hypothetical protein